MPKSADRFEEALENLRAPNKAPELNVLPRWGMDWDGPAGLAAEANAMLALISPRSDTINWLYAYYEPGERWQPIERLVIAEMTPRIHLAGKNAFFRMMGEQDGDSLFNELEGPNPRESGHYEPEHYDYDKKRNIPAGFVYDGLPPNITQRQWWLWRTEGAWARPIWIVQGSHGGHKRTFTQVERQILRFNGRPNVAPWPGQLAFARFDQRILEKLVAMDRLTRWAENMSASWELRTNVDVMRERMEAKQKVDQDIYSWLDSQIADIAA